MRAIICAACKAILGYVEDHGDPTQPAEFMANAHAQVCTASDEEYVQAIFDVKFREITDGLEL